MATKYNEILEYLVLKIENNEYKSGDVLPTERELTTQFNVSRMTVRRALDELIQEGYAFRKSGSGVYVSVDKNIRSANKISVRHDTELLSKYGSIIIKGLEVKEINANRLCQKILHLSKDDKVYCIKRVQASENQPLVYEEIFLPKKYFHYFDEEECYQSMGYLVKKYIKDIHETKSSQIIEAKLASKNVSKLLHVPISSPILQITNIVYSDEHPIYFGIDCFDGYSFKFKSN